MVPVQSILPLQGPCSLGRDHKALEVSFPHWPELPGLWTLAPAVSGWNAVSSTSLPRQLRDSRALSPKRDQQGPSPSWGCSALVTGLRAGTCQRAESPLDTQRRNGEGRGPLTHQVRELGSHTCQAAVRSVAGVTVEPDPPGSQQARRAVHCPRPLCPCVHPTAAGWGPKASADLAQGSPPPVPLPPASRLVTFSPGRPGSGSGWACGPARSLGCPLRGRGGGHRALPGVRAEVSGEGQGCPPPAASRGDPPQGERAAGSPPSLIPGPFALRTGSRAARRRTHPRSRRELRPGGRAPRPARRQGAAEAGGGAPS